MGREHCAGGLTIPDVPWVVTGSPCPWGLLGLGRDGAGGKVLGCWNERAAAVSVSPGQAEGRGCSCGEGRCEERQGRAKEMPRRCQGALAKPQLWLQQLQSLEQELQAGSVSSPRAQLSLLTQLCHPLKMHQGILHRNTFTRRSVGLCLGCFAPFQSCC